jgi:hypothetical protein
VQFAKDLALAFEVSHVAFRVQRIEVMLPCFGQSCIVMLHRIVINLKTLEMFALGFFYDVWGTLGIAEKLLDPNARL